MIYKQAFHNTDLSKFKILLTGGAGFIGSNIADYLMQYNIGYLRILDNLQTGFKQNIAPHLDNPNFEFVEGDISNEQTCINAAKDMDFVIHQAALGSVPRSIENPIATNNANITGFVNILTAAKNAKVKRFIYASSSSVYGDSASLPKVEDNIGKPLSPYAVTKLVNEQYAEVFYKTYKIPIIGLRYFNIFGPKQSPNGPYAAAIPIFINALTNNKSPFINGDGENSRDFTFVENAVQANIKALFADEKAAEAQVYNIAVGERITLNLLFEILKELTQSSINATHREPRPGDIPHSLADISKAQSMLQYQPQIKVKEGLKLTIDWFKNQ